MDVQSLHHYLTTRLLSHGFTDDFFLQVLAFDINLPAYPESPPQDNPSTRDVIVHYCDVDNIFSGQILIQHPDITQLPFIRKVVESGLNELGLDYIDKELMFDMFVSASAATVFNQIPAYLDYLNIDTEYALVATTPSSVMTFRSPHRHMPVPGEYAQITLSKISVKQSTLVIHLINIPARSPEVAAIMKLLSVTKPFCHNFYYQPQNL